MPVAFARPKAASVAEALAADEEAILDRVFFALADPVRRALLVRLDTGPALVSELAAPFAMSLQGVARHIQVLVRAGLVLQERTGRIARCRLEAGPIYAGAVWMNRYTKYWQTQFETLATLVADLPSAGPAVSKARRPLRKGRRAES